LKIEVAPQLKHVLQTAQRLQSQSTQQRAIASDERNVAVPRAFNHPLYRQAQMMVFAE
jgi:hypothetical protein